jgi:redox-sensitive bicupin YhaK (pirin superfamily)
LLQDRGSVVLALACEALRARKGINVGPHPHRVADLHWVIEGEMVHRDSLGYEQVIRPGQVNLMTAGRGFRRGRCGQ